MSKVILENVTKKFGEVTAVSAVDLTIEDGEFTVLVGPSGCGKTTLLRMVAGLEEITEGTVSIGDRVVNNVPPKDRDIAMVFQNYALYPHMNIFENMAFALKLRKFPKEEILERVKEAARILDIGQLLERKPSQLSGGQRQRVALGRAMVRQPSVFLFDEPLSNLDAKLRVQMRAELSKLHSQLKTTSIYVTHDQVEAMTMGTRIAIVKEGALQQAGTPLDIYENPINKFVAGFIGSPPMNFFEAEVVRQDGTVHIMSRDIDLEVKDKLEQKILDAGKQQYVFGIRPEHMHDAEIDSAARFTGGFDGQVEVVEPMGAETYVHLSLGDNKFVARVSPYTKAAFGKTMKVGVEIDKIHVFDKDTFNTIN